MSYVAESFDNEILRLLKAGRIGLLPTDTIYGLSCLASSRVAVERLHKLKRRDKTKPFIILVSDTSQLKEFGIISTDAAPALRYWPGKLTVVCAAPRAPEWLHMGTQTLAVRQPGYLQLCELIAKTGPIISTSANLQGGEPAKSAKQAEKFFGEELDFYVDAGRLGGQPSTIVKPVFGKLKVIRQGAVKIIAKDKL